VPVVVQTIEAADRDHRVTACLQVPGLYKIRYIGQTTLSSAAVCFHCHMPDLTFPSP